MKRDELGPILAGAAFGLWLVYTAFYLWREFTK